jgi:hypothetical protein
MLVYNGSGDVIIPMGMGSPRADQMQGTPHEQLGEIACRICYDSLGIGRSSDALHNHILEVINLSVYEHANFTVIFGGVDPLIVIRSCANRRGIWLESGVDGIEVTTNYRVILEWDRWNRLIHHNSNRVRDVLRHFGALLAPRIVQSPCFEHLPASIRLKEEGLSNDQWWISLHLDDSRSWSHEQVRHRYAISQRSTRYCDESSSPYVPHPLIEQYLSDDDIPFPDRDLLKSKIAQSERADKVAYESCVESLVGYLKSCGVEGTSARKQARGAAMSYLANALYTEMIYSTSITGWKWILSQRLCSAADARMRRVYVNVLNTLQSCTDCFDDFSTMPSPDGIGSVLTA